MILGELNSATSPGTAYTPLVGVDLTLREGAAARLPLRPEFEYAALAISGSVDVDGVRVEPGSILYLGCGRRELPCWPAPTARSCCWAGSRSRRRS